MAKIIKHHVKCIAADCDKATHVISLLSVSHSELLHTFRPSKSHIMSLLFFPPPTVEEGHGGVARILVTPPGWGQPHPQVDAQPAHQRHAGRL